MSWLLLALAAGVAALALVLLTRGHRAEGVGRRTAVVLLQVAGVFLITWLLIGAAQHSFEHSHTVRGSVGPADTALLRRPVASSVTSALRLSLLVMMVAAAAASVAGLVGAVAVTTAQRRRLAVLTPVATLLWVTPTFLIALLVQEFQALVFGLSGLRVAAGFGDVNEVQVFWVALILGVRPTAYFFRQARSALAVDLSSDYARTARAKGLDWNRVVRHHIVRANAALIATAWLNAFRTMIGSLPLVEFLFGYPGLGRVLVLALGLSYGGGYGPVKADLAIGLVVSLALILIVLEGLISGLEQVLDPRLRPLRRGTPA